MKGGQAARTSLGKLGCSGATYSSSSDPAGEVPQDARLRRRTHGSTRRRFALGTAHGAQLRCLRRKEGAPNEAMRPSQGETRREGSVGVVGAVEAAVVVLLLLPLLLLPPPPLLLLLPPPLLLLLLVASSVGIGASNSA